MDAASLATPLRAPPACILFALTMLPFPPFSCPPQVFFLATWTAGRDPMSKFMWAFPLRAVSGLAHLWVMYGLLPDNTLTPWSASSFPMGFTVALLLLSNVHGVLQSIMFMSQISFFTRVAALSPGSGGSVMTLLNTLANLGSMLPAPLVLLGVEALSVRSCVGGVGSCAGADGAAECKAAGGACATTTDGYPIMVALSTLYCVLWWGLMQGRVAALQAAPGASWK